MTVVVMGYRDRDTIVASVDSLLAQASPEPFEIVVVTSGGDGSAAAVRAAHPDVTVIDVEERLFAGGARNRGVAVARGRVIAFLEGDCIATPGWIKARLDAHGAGHAAVASAITTADPQTLSAWAHTFGLFCARLPGRPASVIAPGDPAAHGVSFDRALLDRAGPFPEELRIGEDSAMTRRLHDLGEPIWFEPGVVTAHHGPPTARALVVDRYRRGRRSSLDAGAPSLTIAAALRSWPRDWWRPFRWTLRTAWRNGRSERRRLVLTFPLLVISHTASQAGRYRVRLRRVP